MRTKRQTTLKDIAERVGVSAVAVSHVLNDARTGTRVSDATRQRILIAAKELRYTPNAVAQGLRRQRVQTIGVLFCTVAPPLLINAYAAAILDGVLAQCGASGYNTLIFATSQTADGPANPDVLKSQPMDGVLLVAPQVGSPLIAHFEERGTPLVVLSAPSGDPHVPWVDVDNVKGAQLAARHLLALGHRRIVHVQAYEGQFSAEERRQGFWEELARGGIAERREFLWSGRLEPGWAEAYLQELLVGPELPTAIFTGSAFQAFDLVIAANRLGIAVPETLSIMGFDDYPGASLLSPPLTTIYHPMSEVARLGTELLIERSEGRAITQYAHLLEPSLIVRGTTGPPPGSA